MINHQEQTIPQISHHLNCPLLLPHSVRQHLFHPYLISYLKQHQHEISKQHDAKFSPQQLSLSLGACSVSTDDLNSATLNKYNLRKRILAAYWIRKSNKMVWHIQNLRSKHIPGCDSVPYARGTPIEIELKSLILDSKNGQLVAHIPAKNRLSLKKLKDFLNIKDLSLAATKHLTAKPGRICALAEPVSSIPSVVCDSIFEQKVITTNDSTIHGFLLFSPKILCLLEGSRLANISNK